MSGVWTKLRDGTLSAGAAVRDMANVETLRLAITGLSGAGKTVFLVSVISNLLAMVRGAGGPQATVSAGRAPRRSLP
jgi:predicted YcjX-like family ATPase